MLHLAAQSKHESLASEGRTCDRFDVRVKRDLSCHIEPCSMLACTLHRFRLFMEMKRDE